MRYLTCNDLSLKLNTTHNMILKVAYIQIDR